jgi:NAD(P)-dependent dehydrogenase (short-subunit alcohol dehydrogenase family)
MNPTYDFTGQVALVVGASSGMGLATARAFAEAGRSGVDGATPHAGHSNRVTPISANRWALLGGAPLRTKGEYRRPGGRRTV